jgi:hypothetical protein
MEVNPQQLKVDTDHRKLLREQPADDSSTDQDEFVDEPASLDSVPAELDVIGVSISHAQTYMKSPETPAVDKARAIDASKEYFNDATKLPEIKEVSDRHGSQSITRDPNASQSSQQLSTTSSGSGSQQPNRRSSMIRSILGETDGNRKRSLSGPSMLSSIRKILPDLPSVPGLKNQSTASATKEAYERQLIWSQSSQVKPESGSLGSGSSLSVSNSLPPGSPAPNSVPISNEPYKRDLRWPQEAPYDGARPKEVATAVPSTINGQHAASSSNDPYQRQLKWPQGNQPSYESSPSRRRETVAIPSSPLGLDGNVESLLSPTSPSRMTRSNSDASLYLKRRPTAASAFDDTTAFADVTEMANSRFKAITDSFQNSTLRFPRLPTIKNGAKKDRDLPNTSVDDLTASNTRSNAGTGLKDTEYHYTNMHNIRKSKKLVEVENPQQRAHPILSDALEQTTGDLVIMGGYRGSILRDAKPPHRQLWAPVKVGLNLRNVDLEVGLTREDEENAHKTIFPSGILSHIGPIDIARRLLKHLNKCPNTKNNHLRVHDWGYDWRLSPDLLGQRLISFLESLECNHPETPPEKRGAIVIAHSLGGLITRWAVNQRPELFAGVLYAGVPQHCVNILGPLRHGDDVLLSSKVLTAQVNFTLRTSYALLPEYGRCFINKHTFERYDLDFFDPQVWDEYRLSPCINPAIPPNLKEHRKSIIGSLSDSIGSSLPSLPSVTGPGKRVSRLGGTTDLVSQPGQIVAPNQRPALSSMESTIEPNMQIGKSSSTKSSVATACTIPLPQAKEYLARTLAEVKAFKMALVHDPTLQESNRYPPHAIIFGKTVPTVYGARVLSREHIKYTDAFDDLAFASGDGVVLASAAQLPDGYRCVKGGRVESDRGHVGLLGDLEGVGSCLAALVRAREKGVGMGCYKSG